MSYEFELPCGVVGPGGEIFRGFNVKKLKGRTLREMGKAKARSDAYHLAQTLLKECLIDLEGIKKVTPQVLNEMLAADRAYAFLMIRKKSRGAIIQTQTTCSNCGCENEDPIDLDQQEYYPLRPEDYRVVEWDGQPTRVFDVKSEDPFVDASFRYANGYDEKATAKLAVTNPVENAFRIYQRTCVRWIPEEGEEPLPLPLRFGIWDDLDLDQIEIIERAVFVDKPGPSLQFSGDCVECGKEYDLDLSSSDFLYSSGRNTGRRRSMR